MAKVMVAFDDQEVVQLEAIPLDRDKDAALEYLQSVVLQKLEQQRKSLCKPPF